MKLEKLIREILREEETKRNIENIFVPHNIEGRDEQRIQMIKRKLNRKVIDGNLDLSEIPITDLGNAEVINGNLSLWGNEALKSLGKLKRVNGTLNLGGTNIEDLGNLEYVGDGLYLFGNETLKSLGKLKKVGGWLSLDDTNVEDLGDLEYVGGHIYLRRSKLSKLYSEKEIRERVTVEGEIRF